MDKQICPICGRMYENEENKRNRFVAEPQCVEQESNQDEYLNYYCSHFKFSLAIHKNIVEMDLDNELREEILNLITEYMLHFKVKNNLRTMKRRCFYFNDNESDVDMLDTESRYINVAKLIQNYPRKAIDVANRSLINFSLIYQRYGDIICPTWLEKRISFEHNYNNNHSLGVFLLLEDLGYVKDPDNRECYVITAEGWQKIEQLQKELQISCQGFIAMSFREETKSIREAFRIAIKEAGYNVKIIDEKEHNNQIVPEIFFEINRSKFVVVDVTYPNYGAYYEAGYAQALGKQVIICCREKEFNDKDKGPHFDISQKSMIVWKDEEDLINRLKRRIEATVDDL